MCDGFSNILRVIFGKAVLQRALSPPFPEELPEKMGPGHEVAVCVLHVLSGIFIELENRLLPRC